MSETQVFGKVRIERLTRYSGTDLDDLCEATESAIIEGGGFGWLKPPPRQVLENYWKGMLLVTERRLGPQDAKLGALNVGIHDLPTQGPGRSIAIALAACGVAAGLLFAFGGLAGTRTRSGGGTLQAAVLEELAELERGRASGDVGPKTYERARRELIDALARTLAET